MKRLAQLIDESSLSVADIAARTGLSIARLQDLAAGQRATLQELHALASGMRIPIRSFTTTQPSELESQLFFRHGPNSRPDLGAEAAGEFVAAALTLLPSRDVLPDWIRGFDLPAQSFTDAAAMADQFRANFVGNGVDPLLSLPDLLVSLGGLVLGRLDTSRFEGASAAIDGYAFIFVSPRFSGRMLFTLAHELGHLLAHHRQKPRSASFDLASQIGNARPRDKGEAFVDAFASSLLLPVEGVGVALREIRRALGIKREELGDVEVLYLANFYGVSFEVAARRCEQLELLPQGGAYSLSDHVKQTYGNAEKFAAKAGLPKRPRIEFPRVSGNVLDAAAERVASGEVSVGWVTDRLGCSLSDLYSAKAVRGAPRGNRA